MSSTINTNSLKANEAVTVTVKISGNGNLKLVKNPEVKFPNDFDIYDPKVEIDSKTTVSGVSGTKTVEYMAIPRYAGDFEIPAIEFSYFDTKSGSYKTIKSEPYKLHVEKGEGGDAAAPVVSNFSSNRESVKFLGKDIRYLKTKGFHFTKKGEDVFFGSFMYTLCYLIPLVLFAIFFVIYRKQIKENALNKPVIGIFEKYANTHADFQMYIITAPLGEKYEYQYHLGDRVYIGADEYGRGFFEHQA